VNAPIPLPPYDNRAAVEGWVREHLGHLTFEGADRVVGSRRFTGGQSAADTALNAFDVRGYAARRSEVLPHTRRGASALSPYIRHGLLTLKEVWDHVDGGPPKDVTKYRDELMWQEYSRHLYARLGSKLQAPLRGNPNATGNASAHDPWDPSMACMGLVLDELHNDGWAVNQTRMWMASQWTVRHGATWQQGEQEFFRHLLDGSRAANRTGWQWTVGSGNGKPYGFSRWQVEKRAPGLCDGCAHRRACPIQQWPDTPEWLPSVPQPEELQHDRDVSSTSGPSSVQRTPSTTPEMVWITAESLGEGDPALAANPSLPAVFVFDEALLAKLKLSGKRLVFLAESLAELASYRPLRVHIGSPSNVLAGSPIATTFTPVPGGRKLRALTSINVVELHPWPWLRRPGAGTITSFSAWRNDISKR
jgi:deoxyribodipyrimidine photo-lyase